VNLPAYEDGTECSETSAYKIQTPGNFPEESIQHVTSHWLLMYMLRQNDISFSKIFPFEMKIYHIRVICNTCVRFTYDTH